MIENYIYGVESLSLDELRQRAGGNPFGIVVFGSSISQYANVGPRQAR